LISYGVNGIRQDQVMAILPMRISLRVSPWNRLQGKPGHSK